MRTIRSRIQGEALTKRDYINHKTSLVVLRRPARAASRFVAGAFATDSYCWKYWKLDTCRIDIELVSYRILQNVVAQRRTMSFPGHSSDGSHDGTKYCLASNIWVDVWNISVGWPSNQGNKKTHK